MHSLVGGLGACSPVKILKFRLCQSASRAVGARIFVGILATMALVDLFFSCKFIFEDGTSGVGGHHALLVE